jgi:integral membrane sensor domain MASE1
MKKLSLIITGCLLAASLVVAGNVIVYNKNITVTAAGVTLVNKLPSRKYLLAVNEDATYIVYIATVAISSSTISTIPCLPLSANFGWYEDNFSVYISTWYACTSSATATVHVMQKE